MSDKIVFKGVHKSFGDIHVLDNVSFSIRQKEFFVLFGPSSAGKSTILKLIAGLEYVDSGSIFIDGLDTTAVPANKRKVRMAFENFVLYPHLRVYENLAGVLKNNKMQKKQIDRRVHETTGMLGIEEYLNRLPKQLSGGQKQRVSLGRALVMDSEIYLLDEPLAHLDAKLRNELRTEFQNIKSVLGNATVVYVTHDYSEAMALGDRVCVLYDKHIAQLDTPEAVYLHPANLAVARMFGQPEINVLKLTVDRERNRIFSDTFILELNDQRLISQLKAYTKDQILLGCRPRNWLYTFTKPIDLGYSEAETIGSEIRNFRGVIHTKLSDDKYLSLLTDEYVSVNPGQKIFIKPDLHYSYLFDADTEENLERMEVSECPL